MGRHSAPLPEGSVVDRRPLSLLVGVAAAVLVLVVAGVAYAVSRGDGDGTTTATSTTTSGTPSSPSPSAASPSTTSPAPSTSPSTTTSAPAASTTAKAPRPPTLRLRLVGTSYVRVRSGGKTLLEKVLKKGQTRTFDQRSVTALIGNAGAVRATVNGRPRRAGPSGQIQTIVARR